MSLDLNPSLPWWKVIAYLTECSAQNKAVSSGLGNSDNSNHVS
jgi:hypothetical protein